MNVLKLLPTVAFFLATSCYAANNNDTDGLQLSNMIDDAVGQLMQEYNIPAVAIAITMDGERYFYNYGVVSKETQQPITNETLFEVGSVSKTLTATLAAYAEMNDQLSLSDSVSKHLPFLRGSSFDKVSLLNLGTHTSGGLPLQVPDDIHDIEQVMNYFKNWEPSAPVGTQRSYSNLSHWDAGYDHRPEHGHVF